MREWRWEIIRIEPVAEGLAVTKRYGKFNGQQRIRWAYQAGPSHDVPREDVTTLHPARGPCPECSLRYGATTLCRIVRSLG